MPVPLIHQTDLFRPYNDPDDHWDLACVYALAARGLVDLQGILIDYPAAPRFNPDVEAVAQMNYLHGSHVPVAVGSSRPLVSPGEAALALPQSDRGGADFILGILEQSPSPVAISIVGSCRDVALAANTNRELFRAKCAAVYLNAGYGAPVLDSSWEIEYNVQRDPAAFAAMFTLPTPLFWVPCFEDIRRGIVTQRGSLWWFRQDEVLRSCRPSLRRYFAYALGGVNDPGWLQYLHTAGPDPVLDRIGVEKRLMWSTASLLHCAGYGVDRDGTLTLLGTPASEEIFRFDPVAVTCTDEGITRWEPHQGSNDRFLFRVVDRERYPTAMTRAMRSLLSDDRGEV